MNAADFWNRHSSVVRARATTKPSPTIDSVALERESMPRAKILFFDGVCMLCNATVHFVTRWDTNNA